MTHSFPSHCWVLQGNLRGPHVVVLGGIHGDERTGIEVIRKFLERFHMAQADFGIHPIAGFAGTLTLLLGNPEAIAQDVRSINHQRDLNRYFIQTELDNPASSSDSVELARARMIAPILAQADFVFDIHSTSNPSPAFMVCGEVNDVYLKLFHLLPVSFLLTDPNHVLAQDLNQSNRGTTDAYVEYHGGIGMGYETGYEKDTGHVEDIMDDISRLLNSVGIHGKGCGVVKPLIATNNKQVYALTKSIQAQHDKFTYAPGMDRGWQELIEGQLVGTYEDGTEERIPQSGMLVFPKAEKKIIKGENLYYIATRIL